MNTKIKAGSDQKWEKNNMFVTCNFNMNCNFDCSYCINKSFRKNYSEQLSKEALHNLFSNLPKLNKDFYTFTMAGGEPSLYKYFPEMLQYLSQYFSPNNYRFTCATNGSLLHKFDEYLKNHQNLNFNISISMHLEQMDAETYLKKFSRFSYPNMCRIKIMLEPNTLKKVNHIIEQAKSFGYTDFVVQPVTINGKITPDYTEEEKNFFNNNPYAADVHLFNEYKDNEQTIRKDFTKDEFVLNPELVNYAGLQCLAGHNSIRVLADGTITPCFKVKHDSDFNLNTHSLLEYIYIYQQITCTSTYCGCHGFTAIPKWNPEYAEGPSYLKKEQISSR